MPSGQLTKTKPNRRSREQKKLKRSMTKSSYISSESFISKKANKN